MKVWVLWWKYRDNSGAGVERVYQYEDQARDVMSILDEFELEG
mgnify:CR=1 FL=1